MSYFIPFAMILLGTVAVTIYILGVALRESVRRLADTNEKLMIMLGTREGGAEVGRALVASSRKPAKNIPGVAKPDEKKKDEPKGLRMTVGAR